MNDNKRMKILVWFDIFDTLVNGDDYEKRAERVYDLFDSVDMVYATKGGSYRSACEYTYSNKVHKMPEYVNNDDAVKSYSKEREVGYDRIEVITPVEVLGIILDKNPEELEDVFTQMADGIMPDGQSKPRGINVSNMTEEEMRKNLPGPIADAFHGLTRAIEETSSRAEEIISEYMSACDISGIGESQAKEEGESYMSSEGSIPAAEFICPVNILDKLKQI